MVESWKSWKLWKSMEIMEIMEINGNHGHPLFNAEGASKNGCPKNQETGHPLFDVFCPPMQNGCPQFPHPRLQPQLPSTAFATAEKLKQVAVKSGCPVFHCISDGQRWGERQREMLAGQCFSPGIHRSLRICLKVLISPLVELSWPEIGLSSSSSGRILPASCLPSSTPH